MNDDISVIGKMPVILSGDYHPDQSWFAFMDGAMFRKPINQTPLPPVDIPSRRYCGRAYVSSHYRQPYTCERGVEQHTLPFREFRRVTNAQWADLSAADYPGWGRGDNGSLLVVNYVAPIAHSIVAAWCNENSIGRWRGLPGGVVFEREADYVMTKLRFG